MGNQTILIAGATGTNGQQVVKALQAKNVNLKVFVTNIERARGILGDEIELCDGNLADGDSLKSAFKGVDKAYIVTAVLPNTVELFSNYFNAAKHAGVSHLVKFSGLGSSLDSASEIIRQHAASDDLLEASGLTYTILRPNSFHQNMLWQAAAIAATGTFYLPLGDAAQSTIDVRDIAEITASILTSDGHENKAYDLTGPESLNFHQVAEIISDVRGEPVNYVPVSPEAATAAMTDQGMPEWQVKALVEIQNLFSTGNYADVMPDAERLLGRKPRSFQQFMVDHVDVFRAQ